MNQLADAAKAKDVFGNITPPVEIAPLVQKGGAGGLSVLLNNGITLIYIIAGIAFTVMFVLGAFEWVMSGGDKAKIEGAQKRLVNAFIGILLMAIAFAVIRVVGTFTGFQFFS